MFSIRRNLTRAITFGILLSTAFADVVVLKNGQKVEGKVTKESDQQITVEIKVSASITDERVIPRAEIDRIDKASAETETYKALTAIQLGNNSLTAAQYDAAIRTLQAFIKQYPTSPYTAEVQKTLDGFVEEKKRSDSGDLKFRGRWLTKAEVEAEKVQIGGMIALEQMKAQSATGDNISALNTYAAAEKTYGGSASMPEMAELAKQLASAIIPAVERAIPEQKVLKARKEQGFKDAGPVDRAEMEAAYKAEMAQAEASAGAAEKAGLWPPFNPNNEKCLTALLARANREKTRLAVLPIDKMKKSLQLANSAKQSINSADLAAATVALKEATTLWPANELAGRLTKELAAAQKAAAAAKPPESTSTPAPETPKPKPSTPKPSAALKAVTPAPRPPEDDTPFYMTLPGAIGIVVVIAAALAGVNVYKKMKARASNQEAS